jgi:hypothetical protein
MAVAAALLLGGCSLLPQPSDFIGDSGSSSDESDSSGDGGETIDDNPFLDHEVPDTFPADVPLPDLDVAFSLDLGTGWSVVFNADDLESDFADVVQTYESDGWEVVSQASNDDTTFAVFNSDDYQVQVSGTTDSSDYDGPVLAFTVVAKD